MAWDWNLKILDMARDHMMERSHVWSNSCKLLLVMLVEMSGRRILTRHSIFA
jgi:hypothetical protein